MVRRPDEEVRVGYDGRSLKRGLAGAQGRIKGFLFSVKGLVAAAGVALAAVAVKAFATQEQAEKKLRRALAATGQYSRETEASLRKTASQIQANTKLGDEQALGMMASLIQVGRVAPAQVGIAVEAIASIAEQTGRPITRVARTFAEQIATATQHGTTSLGELEKYLEPFEVERIRRLKSMGKNAEVTAAVVEAMNKKFAGGADVVAGSTDEWKQLSNLWGDLIEVIGGIIHGILSGLIPGLKLVIKWVIGFGEKIQALVYQSKQTTGLISNYFHRAWLRLKRIGEAFPLIFQLAFEKTLNVVIAGDQLHPRGSAGLVPWRRQEIEVGGFHQRHKEARSRVAEGDRGDE